EGETMKEKLNALGRVAGHRHRASYHSNTGRTQCGTIAVVSLVTMLLFASALRAEEPAAPASKEEESSTELAKKTQNPVADLISVPFQNNFNFNTGPEKRTVWDLNIEPVIPFHLTDDWNLITRTIVPIINLPSVAPGVDHAAGLGDINPTL